MIAVMKRLHCAAVLRSRGYWAAMRLAWLLPALVANVLVAWVAFLLAIPYLLLRGECGDVLQELAYDTRRVPAALVEKCSARRWWRSAEDAFNYLWRLPALKS